MYCWNYGVVQGTAGRQPVAPSGRRRRRTMSSTSSPGRDRTPAMSRPLPPIEPRRVPPAVTPPPASPEAGEKQPDDSPLTPQHHLSSRARAKVEPNLGSPSPSRRFRRLSQIRGSGKSPSTPGLLKRLASITSSKGHRAPEKASEEERQSAREQIDELAKKTTSLIGMADLTHVRRLGEGMPVGAKPGQYAAQHCQTHRP